VKHLQQVAGRAESMIAIGNTNLKDTAIIEASRMNGLAQPQWDSSSTIKMTHFDNDAIDYESNSAGNGFAVFSEIYYPKGWNAYIDGKKVDHVNVDYILRGLSIPAGNHKIRFAFEPESVKQGNQLMFIGSILTLLALVGGLFMAWWTGRKKTL
jgi:uncharacterized membrane protein YfhO